jgi:hypothetical protein
VFKQNQYQGYRPAVPEREAPAATMPILIGAAMIAVAILLSTLITAMGSRYSGIESSSDESAWLVDRLTGSVFRCRASERGKASCEPELTTGSIGERSRPQQP